MDPLFRGIVGSYFVPIVAVVSAFIIASGGGWVGRLAPLGEIRVAQPPECQLTAGIPEVFPPSFFVLFASSCCLIAHVSQ